VHSRRSCTEIVGEWRAPYVLRRCISSFTPAIERFPDCTEFPAGYWLRFAAWSHPWLRVVDHGWHAETVAVDNEGVSLGGEGFMPYWDCFYGISGCFVTVFLLFAAVTHGDSDLMSASLCRNADRSVGRLRCDS